jgi:hypothetical protein
MSNNLSDQKFFDNFFRMCIFWAIGLALTELGIFAIIVVTSMVVKEINNVQFVFTDIKFSVAFFAMLCSAIAYWISWVIRGLQKMSISIKIEDMTNYELEQHIAYCKYTLDHRDNDEGVISNYSSKVIKSSALNNKNNDK